MKKVACLILILTLSILLINPFYSEAQGGHGAGHSGGHGAGHSGGHGGYYGGGPGGYHGGWYGGYPGWYYGGWWFPWAVTIAVLPPYYQTIWLGGYPYYYADRTYYAPTTTGGYMVVSPPQGENNQPSSKNQPSMQLFIYPRNGQSEKQQANDRYKCHRWAVGQTNYDPTQPPGGSPSVQKGSDYNRAMTACLDARGYTAK
jgi:hypothetical protein